MCPTTTCTVLVGGWRWSSSKIPSSPKWCNYTNPILTNPTHILLFTLAPLGSYTCIYSCYSPVLPVLPSRGLNCYWFSRNSSFFSISCTINCIIISSCSCNCTFISRRWSLISSSKTSCTMIYTRRWYSCSRRSSSKTSCTMLYTSKSNTNPSIAAIHQSFQSFHHEIKILVFLNFTSEKPVHHEK